MAELTKSDNAQILRTLLEAYGVGVRAGVLTPCLQDENEFREMMGLAQAPQEVVAQWAKTDGIRLPITLQRSLAEGQDQKLAGVENEKDDQ